MRSIQDIAAEIVAREGGFVNDPDDPGGATKFGVTIPTLRNLPWGDLDGDGDRDIEDVRALTRDHAIQIFVGRYFHGPRLDMLPEPLQESAFDFSVNSGGHSIRVLQKLLNRAGFGPLSVDGAMGPETARAANRAHQKMGQALVDSYGIARRNWLYRIGDRRPGSRKFARRRDGGKGGWILRAEEFIRPAYHLSEAQHQDRVVSWG